MDKAFTMSGISSNWKKNQINLLNIIDLNFLNIQTLQVFSLRTFRNFISLACIHIETFSWFIQDYTFHTSSETHSRSRFFLPYVREARLAVGFQQCISH